MFRYSDTSNLSGALEFSENMSKVGTQPLLDHKLILILKTITDFLQLLQKIK